MGMTNINVVIRGERIARVSDAEFRPYLRERGLVATNLGSDADIDEWSISDPYSLETVGRAYVR